LRTKTLPAFADPRNVSTPAADSGGRMGRHLQCRDPWL